MYELRPGDRPLIEAALRLGDWILARPDVTDRQRAAVGVLQAALRGLPAAPPNLIAEYGFHVRYDPENGGGLYRAWRVSLSPAGLEIYSVYSPDQKIEREEKLSHELNFWLRPNRVSRHDGFYVAEWIEEVNDPDRFRAGAADFTIVAETEVPDGAVN
jgi:hypothetical protein